MPQIREAPPSPISRGASRQSTEKRRPLRTYSKRARSTEADALPKPAKKQKVTDSHPTVQTPESPQLPQPSPLAHASNIPKGSILSYFKPCRSSSAPEPSDLLSDSEKLTDTPPSSPPALPTFKAIRGPRRLRLRHNTAIPPSTDPADDVEDESETEESGEKRISKMSTRQKEEHMKEDGDNNSLDRRGSSPKFSTTKPAQRPKVTPMVQTTINISSKPTFEECKTCRMVFNPLHPPDVKFHTQKHAAFLRSRAKSRA